MRKRCYGFELYHAQENKSKQMQIRIRLVLKRKTNRPTRSVNAVKSMITLTVFVTIDGNHNRLVATEGEY